MKWEVVGKSHIGTKRSINEDRYFMHATLPIWAVADGMGGYSAGDMASHILIDEFDHISEEYFSHPFKLMQHIEQILMSGNKKIRSYAEQNGLETIGTTMVCASFVLNLGLCLWIGDSRLYQIRQGILTQITRDHSLVQELLNFGEIDEQEALTHPARNIITRAVGSDYSITPDVLFFYPEEHDIYLLCSDGFYNALTHDIWHPIIQHEQNLERALDKIFEQALHQGADDNLTALIIRVQPS